MPTYNNTPPAPAAFPSATVDCDYPHAAVVKFENVISTSYSGKEKRATKVPERRMFRLRFEQLTHADADTLWDHYRGQTGTLTSFSYTDYNSGETFTVRYVNDSLSRESFIFDAERVGIELIEVI
jgi:hypothetical protein